MKKQVAVIICLALSLCGSLKAEYQWFTNPANGHKYALTVNYAPWAECEAEAVAVGGHLVTVNSEEEMNWILGEDKPFGKSFALGYPDHPAWNGIWIGLEHIGGEKINPNSWQYTSGEPITFWNPDTLNWDYTDKLNGIHMTMAGIYNVPNTGTFNCNPDHDTESSSYLKGIIEVETDYGIDIDFVTIGNAGNGADTTGLGAVGYEYQISKYEITNEQWISFTLAVGPPIGNPSNAYNIGTYFYRSNQPVTGVGWYEAAQFCNYLTSGDKSKGVYQFSGDNTNPGDFLSIDRSAAKATYGNIYFLPTLDEWYKAAYYKPDGSGYSLYANGTNIAPIAGVQSNYSFGWDGTPWNVGTGTEEQNGTFDIMGNVWEWNENESFVETSHDTRGGSFIESATRFAADYKLTAVYPDYQVHHLGFRVAKAPEVTPPIADANGPYTIYVDDALTLDGSGSTDEDNDIVSYMWDLDDNGTFETDANDQAVYEVNYAYLQSLGLLVDYTYNIHLKVTDSKGNSDVSDTTLTILPKHATINLLLWYKFDETGGNMAYDSSGKDFHGNVVGPIMGWLPNSGKDGGCREFRNDTAVLVPSDSIIGVEKEITISVWLKNAWREDETNLAFDTGIGESFIRTAVVTYPQREVLWRAGNETEDVLTWDLSGLEPDNLGDQWHHWVFVKSENQNKMQIYYDGALAAEKIGVAMGTLATARGAPFKIGSFISQVNTFIGQMDDFKVFDSALTTEEISNLLREGSNLKNAWNPYPYCGSVGNPVNIILDWSPGDNAISHDLYFGTNYADVNSANSVSHPNVYYVNLVDDCFIPSENFDYFTEYYWRVDERDGISIYKGDVWDFRTQEFTEDPNLLLWYKFDETGGKVVIDSSGYENHGSLREYGLGIVWDPNGGYYEGCLNFNDNREISVPAQTLSDITDRITVSVWLKGVFRTDYDNVVFETGYGSSLMQAIAVTNPQREVRWRVGNDTNDMLAWDLDGLDPIEISDQWHLWTFVKDETNDRMDMYYDAELVATKTGTSKSLAKIVGSLFDIGGVLSQYTTYIGRMDDFRIYNYSLSSQEINEFFRNQELNIAWSPYPMNNSMNVDPSVVLHWNQGNNAFLHNVYFGTDFDEVNNADIFSPAYKGYYSLDHNFYDPFGDLKLGTRYYWRIDDIDSFNIWKGNVWSFIVPSLYYVDKDATGSNNGSTWNNAFNHLQDAISKVNSNNLPAEIRVAEGIYFPDSNSVYPDGTGDRFATFTLSNYMLLKGGYAGFGNSEPNYRDVALYDTVLSGDLGKNDTSIDDPCDLFSETTRGENSYHVVTSIQNDMTAVLDGFVITAGNANDQENSGGGIYIYYSSPRVRNCTISKNTAVNGGGWCNLTHARPIISDCNFYCNASFKDGGGINNLSFSGPMIADCLFLKNWAGGSGGAIINRQTAASPLIRCVFVSNSAYLNGGGIQNVRNYPILTNCLFISNSAYRNGGGIANSGSSPDVINSVFSGNIAGIDGSSLYGNVRNVTNCTIVGNLSKSQGAAISGCKGVITNSIIWDNLPYDRPLYDSSVPTFSCVQGGSEGLDCIDSDPLFGESGYWDSNGTPTDPNDDSWVKGDYHLKSAFGRWDPSMQSWLYDDINSPCVDAGDPNSDWSEELWPHGERINMGAYGGTPEASMSPSGIGNGADLYHDGIVNFIDYALWAKICKGNNSGTIPYGQVTVDGDLSEWSENVEWLSLDKVYYQNPSDVVEAKFALRWNNQTNKIYAAVVVYDLDHVFNDEYVRWDASDRIEIYSQGDAEGGSDWTRIYDVAQQYYVSPDTNGSWATWAWGETKDINDVLEYAVSVKGDYIIYEVSVTPFDNYGGFSGGDTVITDLEAGKTIAFDIVANTRRSGGFGMLSENNMTGKSENADYFARYKLVDKVPLHDYFTIAEFDLDRNGVFNSTDLEILSENWLESY